MLKLLNFAVASLLVCIYTTKPISIRAGRYDDIYRMDEIKSFIYRFMLCSIVYFVVSQNTLFTVIVFHHLDDCVKGRHRSSWLRVGARSDTTKQGARS